MIRASVLARGKLNSKFNAGEWGNVAGSAHEWRVLNAARTANPPWVSGFFSEAVSLPGKLVLIAADQVANIAGAEPGWATEILPDGRPGSRPNGIILAYSFDYEAVKKFGLPHKEELKTAFGEDALRILRDAYARQGPVAPLQREFPTSALGPAQEWSSDGLHAAAGSKKKLARSTGRMIVIASTIAAIAVVGIAAWRMLQSEQETARIQQTR